MNNDETKLYELTDAEASLVWRALLAYMGLEADEKELFQKLVEKFEE